MKPEIYGPLCKAVGNSKDKAKGYMFATIDYEGNVELFANGSPMECNFMIKVASNHVTKLMNETSTSNPPPSPIAAVPDVAPIIPMNPETPPSA